MCCGGRLGNGIVNIAKELIQGVASPLVWVGDLEVGDSCPLQVRCHYYGTSYTGKRQLVLSVAAAGCPFKV